MGRDRLDELVELMVGTVCSCRERIRIAEDDFRRRWSIPLNSSHIEYVPDLMRDNTTYVRIIKK